MRNNVYTYDRVLHDITFQAGQTLSMSSNPCLVNMPTYSGQSMSPVILNGISISIRSYAANGNATVRIAYNDVTIKNDTRYTGLIHLPDITQNANPDIIIPANVTLSIDKSGTPNRHRKNAANDFINPTEFHCLDGSVFLMNPGSKTILKDESSFLLNYGSTLTIQDGAELIVEEGSTLIVRIGANLNIQGSGKITIKSGGSMCVIPGANIHLQNYNSIIAMQPGANSSSGSSCQSPITFTGNGSIPNYNQDVYIQNETISTNRYIGGRNIYIGSNVTTSKPQGNVVLRNNANVVFDAQNVVFDSGFECALGASFEVK